MLRVAGEQFLQKNQIFRKLLFVSEPNFSTKVNVPSSADVVIIGGGSIGCNTLYQLAKRGVNVVLCERNKLTSGTTWHTEGLLWRLRPGDIPMQLLNRATKLLPSLEEETGLNPGYVQNGGLFISRTEERLNEYKRLHTLGKYFGIESYIISAEEAVKLHPLLNPKDFTAALYSPGDGCVDPTMLCNSLVKGAANNGGKVIEDCAITKILTDSGRVTGVETPYGTIKTTCVVNAGGVWGKNIARLVNLDIPMVTIRNTYVVTGFISEAKNAPNIRDHDASICYKTLGNTLCVSAFEDNPELIKHVADDFAFKLYELDLPAFSVYLEKAVNLTPVMNDVGIKTDICGPESFTPDHKPLMGEDPNVTGFFHACGFNGGGMMLGPGCAEQLAIWITKGRPELPMIDYDIRRFTPTMRSNQVWIDETSTEAYSTNYNIVFPCCQPLAGRNLKKSIFHEHLVSKGAVMEQSQEWERPGYFIQNNTAPVESYHTFRYLNRTNNSDKRYEKQLQGDETFSFSKHHTLIGEEVSAVRKHVAFFDLSYNYKFFLNGPDAQHAANWLFTADVNEEVNKPIYSCILNGKGGVEGDVSVISLSKEVGLLEGFPLKGNGYYIVGDGKWRNHILWHLQKEIQRKRLNAVLSDVTENIGILSVKGPKSEKILEALIERPLINTNFQPSMSQLVSINGETCRVVPLNYLSELGYELHIPLVSCISIYEKLLKVGKAYNLKNAGFRALHSLNCEEGRYLWNKDLRSDDNPVEANLESICKNGEDYLGKYHVDQLKKNEVTKRRAFFTINQEIPLWGEETIWRNNVLVGYLRRGDYGHYLKSSIGIGYITDPKNLLVSKEYLRTGNYEIEVMNKRYPASIYECSPFKCTEDHRSDNNN